MAVGGHEEVEVRSWHYVAFCEDDVEEDEGRAEIGAGEEYNIGISVGH